MTTLESSGQAANPQLMVLHAVRLAGFADIEAIASRTGIAVPHIPLVLEVVTEKGLVQEFAFGDSIGWILTDDGRDRADEWLVAEVRASGAGAVLADAADAFEPLNTDLVAAVSAWQLATHNDVGQAAAVLAELRRIEPALGSTLARLTEVLPRFGRYVPQYSAALRRAESGEHRWIAGVGILSCHTVWAELHQDLLSSLGRRRDAGANTGG